MKPNRSNPLFACFSGASLATLIVLSGSASALERIKDNNPLALNLTTSWVGGVVPTTADVAVWNNTVTGAMVPGLGANATWLGLKVVNPGGLVTIGDGNNGLFITTSGIDMSAATQDVVLSPAWLDFSGGAQIWNVVAGRNLRLAKSAAGAANSDVDGNATITVSGGGLVDANQGSTTGAGFANFTGKFIIGSGTTLRGLGATTFAWGTSTAADAITLNGGTLAVGGITGTQGDWTWGQPITLGTSTTSKLSAQNPDAAAHSLTLTGAITGSGNLTFEKTQTGVHTFILNNIGTAAGSRTNVMGTGDITVNGVTLEPLAGGTTNVITHNNKIKLIGGTLLSGDAYQEFAGTITLEGSNTIRPNWDNKPVTISGNMADGSVAGGLNITSGPVTIKGTNTYTGGSTFTAGNVYVTGAQGLGTGMVTNDGGQLLFQPTTAGITSAVNSLRSRSDVHLNNGVLLNITSGSLGMRQTNGFWIKNSAGTAGRLTSSSNTLNIASVDATWATTTGALGAADHQINTPIVDFDGSSHLAVTKSGANQLILNGANTYSGGTTINGGRLQAGNVSALGSGQATVNSGGQVFLNVQAGSYANNFSIAGVGPLEGTDNFGALRFGNNTIAGNVAIATGGARICIAAANTTGTISGALSGTDLLEINSATAPVGTALVLSGNNSGYTGAATLSKGTLTISNSFGGSIAKASGTTLINNGTVNSAHSHTTGILQGTGTFVGGLTLNGATTADVLNIVPGALHVTGDVNLAGLTTVRASGLGGSIPVLYYTGTVTGSPSNLTVENASSFRGAATFDTSVQGIISLNISGAPVTWSAGTNMIWDVATLNWKNGANPDKYFQSDMVTFGNTGAGSVYITGVLAPSSITINNSLGNNYTFAGMTAADYISGTTGITKTGDGSLTLQTSNTFLGAVSLGGGTTTIFARQVYTGGTSIAAGAILDITGGGGLTGSIRGTVNVNGGILRLSAGDATGYSVASDRISAMNISNGGTLEINNNANTGFNQTFSNMAINLTGGRIIKGALAGNGNIDIFNGSTSITSQASAATSVIDAGVNLGLRQANTTISTAPGTTPTGIDLEIDGSINCSAYTYPNPNLIKEGAGTLCLNNSLTVGIGTTGIYSGTTTINGGTLMVGNGGNTGIIGTGAIIDNAALVFNRNDDLTIANAITGTGSLEQRGSGALILANGGTRSGSTIVTNGSLHTGTVPFTASTFRVNGGTFSASTPAAAGTGTVASLEFNGGAAAFRVNPALSDKIIVTGTNGLTVNADTTISFAPSGNFQLGDTVQLFDYDGAIGGSKGFDGLHLASTGNPHLVFTLTNNVTDTRVDATVTVADTLIWKGAGDTWDKVATTNWKTTSNNTDTQFYDLDKVQFTDAGSANTTVLLSGDLIPSSVEFNATIPYIVDAPSGGVITGVASFVKKNTGTVTILAENTYTGATAIEGGTLQIGDGLTTWGSLGATAITIGAQGTLAYSHSGNFTVEPAISGTGQLVQRGPGQMTLNGTNTFNGPIVVEAGTLVIGNAGALGTSASGITVNAGGTVNINNLTIPAGENISIAGTGVAGFAVTGDGTVQSNLILTTNATIGNTNANTLQLGIATAPVTITGAHTLTKDGTSKVWYRAPENGVGNTLAALVVNGGTFGIEANDNGLKDVPITVNSGGGLSSWAKADRATPTTQNNPITLNGGSLGAAFAGQTWSGPIALTANSTLGAVDSGFDFTISGPVSGPHGLAKTEAGTVTLSAVNTYTGNTTVNTGAITLAANAGLKFVPGTNGVCNRITGAGTATLNGNFTLDLSGAAIADGNSWTLVDITNKTYGTNFAVAGFNKSAGVHTKVVGNQTWTFSESTGVLSLAITAGYDSWSLQITDVTKRGRQDDADGDGFTNLQEYLFGTSPVANTGTLVTSEKTGGNLVLHWLQRKTGTSFLLKESATMSAGSWSTSAIVPVAETGAPADYDAYKATITIDAARKFFRVEGTEN